MDAQRSQILTLRIVLCEKSFPIFVPVRQEHIPARWLHVHR